MGAPEQQGVHLGIQHGRQKPFCQNVHLGAVEVPAFDELDEPGTGHCLQLHLGAFGAPIGTPTAGEYASERRLVGTGPHRSDGSDHGHPTGDRCIHQRPHTRFDDSDHRHRHRFGEFVQRRRGCGVACDHEGLDVVVRHEVLCDSVRESCNLVEGPGTIGIAGRVPEIHEILIGQQVDHRPCNREAAEARIEHSDRPLVHLRRIPPGVSRPAAGPPTAPVQK